ncbi:MULTISPECIES: hypothetical protein [Nostoc]|uniref:hypothetical protein n=1 Tax=Nostoc TaxID=1177 RepID=UPI0018F056B2|nr:MULTISPECIES: hypothetical protein [Nostoc]
MQIGKSEELRQWTRKVIEKMPNLTKPQAVVLAMWSFGIVMTQSSGLTTVSSSGTGCLAAFKYSSTTSGSVIQRLNNLF